MTIHFQDIDPDILSQWEQEFEDVEIPDKDYAPTSAELFRILTMCKIKGRSKARTKEAKLALILS